MQIVAVHSLSKASGDIYPLELNTPFVLYDHGHATKRTSVFTEMQRRPILKAKHEDNATYVKD